VIKISTLLSFLISKGNIKEYNYLYKLANGETPEEYLEGYPGIYEIFKNDNKPAGAYISLLNQIKSKFEVEDSEIDNFVSSKASNFSDITSILRMKKEEIKREKKESVFSEFNLSDEDILRFEQANATKEEVAFIVNEETRGAHLLGESIGDLVTIKGITDYLLSSGVELEKRSVVEFANMDEAMQFFQDKKFDHDNAKSETSKQKTIDKLERYYKYIYDGHIDEGHEYEGYEEVVPGIAKETSEIIYKSQDIMVVRSWSKEAAQYWERGAVNVDDSGRARFATCTSRIDEPEGFKRENLYSSYRNYIMFQILRGLDSVEPKYQFEMSSPDDMITVCYNVIKGDIVWAGSTTVNSNDRPVTREYFLKTLGEDTGRFLISKLNEIYKSTAESIFLRDPRLYLSNRLYEDDRLPHLYENVLKACDLSVFSDRKGEISDTCFVRWMEVQTKEVGIDGIRDLVKEVPYVYFLKNMENIPMFSDMKNDMFKRLNAAEVIDAASGLSQVRAWLDNLGNNGVIESIKNMSDKDKQFFYGKKYKDEHIHAFEEIESRMLSDESASLAFVYEMGDIYFNFKYFEKEEYVFCYEEMLKHVGPGKLCFLPGDHLEYWFEEVYSEELFTFTKDLNTEVINRIFGRSSEHNKVRLIFEYAEQGNAEVMSLAEKLKGTSHFNELIAALTGSNFRIPKGNFDQLSFEEECLDIVIENLKIVPHETNKNILLINQDLLSQRKERFFDIVQSMKPYYFFLTKNISKLSKYRDTFDDEILSNILKFKESSESNIKESEEDVEAGLFSSPMFHELIPQKIDELIDCANLLSSGGRGCFQAIQRIIDFSIITDSNKNIHLDSNSARGIIVSELLKNISDNGRISEDSMDNFIIRIIDPSKERISKDILKLFSEEILESENAHDFLMRQTGLMNMFTGTEYKQKFKDLIKNPIKRAFKVLSRSKIFMLPGLNRDDRDTVHSWCTQSYFKYEKRMTKMLVEKYLEEMNIPREKW
jgi:hypothetical protein